MNMVVSYHNTGFLWKIIPGPSSSNSMLLQRQEIRGWEVACACSTFSKNLSQYFDANGNTDVHPKLSATTYTHIRESCISYICQIIFLSNDISWNDLLKKLINISVLSYFRCWIHHFTRVWVAILEKIIIFCREKHHACLIRLLETLFIY